MNDLKNELPEDFQLNRHAPIQDQLAKSKNQKSKKKL
jgi:hypothetical protein